MAEAAAAVDVTAPVVPEVADTKTKKASKPKKAKSPRAYPSFYEMISDAIVTLKEKNGSSQYAITKFTEEKYKQLPSNFRKLLLLQLKKLVVSGKLVKVKNSYKLVPAKQASMPAKKPAAAKAKTGKVVDKPKPKTASKTKATSKPKTASKTKATSKPKTASKTKATSKPKANAAVKPKPKPKTEAKPSKAAKTASRTSPGKKLAKPKKAVPVKNMKKPRTAKSPAVKKATKKMAKK